MWYGGPKGRMTTKLQGHSVSSTDQSFQAGAASDMMWKVSPEFVDAAGGDGNEVMTNEVGTYKWPSRKMNTPQAVQMPATDADTFTASPAAAASTEPLKSSTSDDENLRLSGVVRLAQRRASSTCSTAANTAEGNAARQPVALADPSRAGKELPDTL